MRKSGCAACSRSIGWVGLAVSAVLLVMKAFVGLIGGSQAMLADAMYSLKDMLNALMVVIGTNISSKPLDAEHPYGHGKVEFILSMVVSVVFIGLTGYLLIHAVQILLDESRHRTPHLIVLWAALVSVGVNLAMYFYSRCVAIETNSPIIKTMAKHHHGDATASGAVALGIIGAHYLNMPWLDPAVALWETVDLLLLGRVVFLDAYRGLMDHSVSEGVLNRIVGIAEKVDGVRSVIHLRARNVGQGIWADMIVGVDPEHTVEDAHRICETVQATVCGALKRVESLHVSAEVEEMADSRETTFSAEPLSFDEAVLSKGER
ncbi:magnetosome biogenesis CDF transporter MamM [Magnetospirillum sp. UT-4]|uniref:magnetosome biogenesis CDF transporter MamM n=1 Tax=Magnetospirillum sp. UT-4 TaxID=2681467 RepID=UPI001383AD80|nr:magnetosome biogenesis CDF transporter MamM [Magnetospirillum sp. UT-4]CAA7622264.1 Predicted Co/Zn/Cd cation transporters [Magnetospirillum sp. UT-4]